MTSTPPWIEAIVLFEMIVVAAVAVLTVRRSALLVASLCRPRPLSPASDFLSVAVLVPARNEATVAPRILEALSGLDYPAERLSFVLIADGCTDNTAALFREWAAKRSDAQVL